MKRCCHCKQIKPFNEFYKNKGKKDGYTGECKTCVLSYQKSYRANNQEELKIKSLEYAKSHRSEALQRARAWYQNNKATKQEYDKEYAKTKMPKRRLASKKWREAHPNKKNADTIARRLALDKRLPLWADLKAIKQFYQDCPKGYHVDHIIPLRAKLVSGLHVLNNLQYLPQIENMTKSNHYSYGE